MAREPGLYFVGLHFLYSMSSEMIHGVGRDAGPHLPATWPAARRGREGLAVARWRLEP